MEALVLKCKKSYFDYAQIGEVRFNICRSVHHHLVLNISIQMGYGAKVGLEPPFHTAIDIKILLSSTDKPQTSEKRQFARLTFHTLHNLTSQSSAASTALS
jgi:hypothetical protein